MKSSKKLVEEFDHVMIFFREKQNRSKPKMGGHGCEIIVSMAFSKDCLYKSVINFISEKFVFELVDLTGRSIGPFFDNF